MCCGFVVVSQGKMEDAAITPIARPGNGASLAFIVDFKQYVIVRFEVLE